MREAFDAGLPAPDYLTKGDQYRRIQGLFHAEPRYKAVHSQVLQNVADRIEEGTRRWFEALRDGRTDVRPPHSQPRKKCRSFTYTQYGTAALLRDGRVHLSKLGSFRVFDYRKMRGRRKSVTLSIEAADKHAGEKARQREGSAACSSRAANRAPEQGAARRG